MLKKLTIKGKLILLSITPLVLILYLTTVYIVSLANSYQTLKNSDIKEAKYVSNLIHELQTERGLSAGFLSSKGVNNKEALQEHRKKSDEALKILTEYQKRLNSNKDTKDEVSLQEKRALIDSINITAPQSTSFYSLYISSLCNSYKTILQLIDDSEVKNQLLSHYWLILAKENLGQLRANLNSAFTQNEFKDDLFAKVGANKVNFENLLNSFQSDTNKEILNYFKEKYQDNSIALSQNMINTAFEKNKEGNFNVNPKEWFSNVTKNINILKEVEDYSINSIEKIIENRLNNFGTEILITSLFILISIIFILFLIVKISSNIVGSINSFKEGLLTFFSYLNRQTTNIQYLDTSSNDEISKMSEVVNLNIQKIEQNIANENIVLYEINDMVKNIERGLFMYRINAKCHNNQIETIRENINTLANDLQVKISSISNVLSDFSLSHYESRIPDDLIMTGTYGSLKSSTRLIGNNVSELLAIILTVGTSLNENLITLTSSSKDLSVNANIAAASLEETAAALEEITSNIRINVASINQMSKLSNGVTQSVIDGEKLANETTKAMEDLSTQVHLVNDAISVIDQIAFQTNILSLNAAVEAATAGDAGLGFAVVAQEVRNLASRSAEAAKEIKDIVEKATQKANEGKNIATNMIEGYKSLNTHVSQTTNLIQDIEMASKEQLLGIEQINDAVNKLDQQTQQNAVISNKISDLSNDVSSLSKDLVDTASLTNFSKHAKDYISDIDLVFKIARLKNDHIRFKENNFAKLGKNERWDVVSCNDCNLGKWIKESEHKGKKYTQATNWSSLKQHHEELHNNVQIYINEDINKNFTVDQDKLLKSMEDSTYHIFNELNTVKKNICL